MLDDPPGRWRGGPSETAQLGAVHFFMNANPSWAGGAEGGGGGLGPSPCFASRRATACAGRWRSRGGACGGRRRGRWRGRSGRSVFHIAPRAGHLPTGPFVGSFVGSRRCGGLREWSAHRDPHRGRRGSDRAGPGRRRGSPVRSPRRHAGLGPDPVNSDGSAGASPEPVGTSLAADRLKFVLSLRTPAASAALPSLPSDRRPRRRARCIHRVRSRRPRAAVHAPGRRAGGAAKRPGSQSIRRGDRLVSAREEDAMRPCGCHEIGRRRNAGLRR